MYLTQLDCDNNGCGVALFRMQVYRFDPCPLTVRLPYLPPRRRPVPDAIADRLRAQLRECVQLERSVEIRVVEWVGADPTTYSHAVCLSFEQAGHTKRAEVFKAAERIEFVDVHAAWQQALQRGDDNVLGGLGSVASRI